MNPFESQVLFLRILLLLLIYGFLLSVLVFLWRDLKVSTRRSSQPAQAAQRLVVVEGDDTGPPAGTTFPLESQTALGRDMSNTVVLPDAFVSGRHAKLVQRRGHWWLEDLGSRNGTFVNNRRIAEPTRVQAGDLIGIGHTVLRLEV